MIVSSVDSMYLVLVLNNPRNEVFVICKSDISCMFNIHIVQRKGNVRSHRREGDNAYMCIVYLSFVETIKYNNLY